MRGHLAKLLTGQAAMVLDAHRPTHQALVERFKDIREYGLYLHIPFCRQICPYCPYNKERYHQANARSYARAMMQEIDFYADIVGDRPMTSLYIGGGTPTTMLGDGLADILDHVRATFNVQGDVHLESHLNDLSEENLDRIQALGVRNLSMGVEALQDRHLRFLQRPYNAEKALATVRRAMDRDFECVNVDLMFALPGQTTEEIAAAAHMLVDLGVDQVATYPLFRFPYTRMGSGGHVSNYGLGLILKRRGMLKAFERIFYGAGYDRTSVWAFTKAGVPKYCSVTVPLYIGLGASGGSYLRDAFYLNTFSVQEYVNAMEKEGTAIALSMDLSDKMQMAGWLYWRIYETEFTRQDFHERFGRRFDSVYGNYVLPLQALGWARDDGERISLTDAGIYWLHALEDIFSIDYISTLWGTSKQEPWPQRVTL